MAPSPHKSSHIALIGAGCRFPGDATSPSKLWDLLRNPRQLAEPIPHDRFSANGYYHENAQYHGHFNVKRSYFLAGDGAYRRFDAGFFGMNPVEAVSLDPQCRLLLETVYEALEDSGLTIEQLRGSDTAVYTGQMVADYDHLLSRDTDHSLGTYHASGTSHAILSNRISYFFDWHGPSMTIDTACSSSLVALHHAVQHLRTGHSRVAIAAGSNLIMDPECFISLSSLNMLSPDGYSRMWDAGANGYARGEGVAAIVLKTLDAALEDGDEIECIVRETAFAQDGKTQGITSPNHVAQTQLIRDCYSRAGLDPSISVHQPQFFECHGTGTLAGDAAEAEAIKSAFFPASNGSRAPKDRRLLVGSIKSVMGHTESTAGIAGVLKAALALKNGIVPPNLLFKRLNPRIEPHYANLQVSTVVSPWPQVEPGTPRRASVNRAIYSRWYKNPKTSSNSFGFGGANAHAILESYEPEQFAQPAPRDSLPVTVYTPFVFSAISKKSLLAYLGRFFEFLQTKASSIHLRDLAYTLHSRRTRFQVALAITASDVDELSRKIQSIILDPKSDLLISSERAVASAKQNTVAIFTGQGAQWAGMGSHLLRTSNTARQIIENMERRLAMLPDADRPAWSLSQVLLEEPSSLHAKVMRAELSQPLCTAVQILQVDLLRAAGIKFAAVVGHSSGEIAAAYAAGFLTAEDAICIAYYRGLHSHLASHNGAAGSMLAVGTTAEDALDLCTQPEFSDRVSIAAINSSASVTISGDRDAIEELKIILEDEQKFVRILKVDRAYHSHHMMPCSAAYLESLAALNIQVGKGQLATWFSSVFDGPEMSSHQHLLDGPYWDANMINTVQFKDALSRASESQGPFSLAIEIGPHPALRGPAMQIIQDVSGGSLPYTGVFSRGISAVESISECLGHVWRTLGKDGVDLQAYERFTSGASGFRLAKGLPTYSWEHGEFWNESRYAKAMRLRPGPVHELLGHMTPDSTETDLRWRHILQPSEIPWLTGHQLQGQIVLPAAAYVSTALEAALATCNHRNITSSLIELSNVEFHRALVFVGDKSTVEIVVSMTNIVHRDPTIIEASFTYHASDGQGDDNLHLFSDCRVRITAGIPSPDMLPPRPPKPPSLIKVSADEFYSASRDLDYEWAGPFVGLRDLERKLGVATGRLCITESSPLLIQPALFDLAFQALLLGYSYPDDGQLWTIHVPKRVGCLTVNPYLCVSQMNKGNSLPFFAYHDPDTIAMIGNSNVYPNNPAVDNAMIQIEELECVPLSHATSQDDKVAFATVLWNVAQPDFDAISLDPGTIKSDHSDLARHIKRMLQYYARMFEAEFGPDHPSRVDGPYTRLLNSMTSRVSRTQSCSHREWEDDTYDQLILASKPLLPNYSIEMLQNVGQSMIDTIKGDRPAIKVPDTMVRQFHTNGIGLDIYNQFLGKIMKQIVHRYPNLDILQVGSGTGAATQAILDQVGATFSSYTFTDISSRFFDSVNDFLSPHLPKFMSKTLNLNKDPLAQGFTEGSFDVAVASLVLHRTPNPEQALQNIRRLLKPGGHLIILEPISDTYSVYEFILESMPQWWHGPSISRSLTLPEWDGMLRKLDFSGCDTISPHVGEDGDISSRFAVFVTQSMDEKMTFLRHPIITTPPGDIMPGTLMQDLVIIGGSGSDTDSSLADKIISLTRGHCENVRTFRDLPDLSGHTIKPDTTVLSLIQLESTVFEHIDNAEWDALKMVLMMAGSLLWVSQGRRASNPFAAMMVGFVRSVIREVPSLHYQMLDFEESHDVSARPIAEALLRFQAEHKWLKEDGISTSVENEIVLVNGTQPIIPRLIMSRDLNDRYNSLRRRISVHCNPRKYNVVLAASTTSSGYELKQEPIHSTRGVTTDITVVTAQATLSAIRLSTSGYMFLVLGYDPESGVPRIGFSTTHSSRTRFFSEDLCVVCRIPDGYATKFLSQVAFRLLALAILSGTSPGDTVLAYEPEDEMTAVLVDEAHRCGVHVVFITVKTNNMPADILAGSDWVCIHKSSPSSILLGIVPNNASVFVDFTDTAESEFTRKRILSLLPLGCRQENYKTLLSTDAWLPSSLQFCLYNKLLNKALDHSFSSLTMANSRKHGSLPILHPEAIKSDRNRLAPISVVDWTTCSSISVRVQPSADRIVFSDNGTYWLAGLSRGLGLGLCEWMVRRGARNFAITSRNPQIDASWLDQMYKTGVKIKVASCDVTVKERVRTVHDEICCSMPPILGVCQGSRTRPKVEGSLHLNDIFQEDTLEFFIFFSSVVSTIGRQGQANYSAANMFMTSLAEQRRRKGLAASVIHIGPIYGIGLGAGGPKVYTKATFRSSALVPTSERDFYQLFVEAVTAGRTDSACDTIEFLSGVRKINSHDQDRPLWEADPLMSHLVQKGREEAGASTGSHVHIPLKSQLAQATTRVQLYDIIRSALLQKLYSLFQIDTKHMATTELVAKRLDELGTDSLLATELRGWFMQTLEVNVPTLKILSGVLVNELILLATDTIPNRLTPGLALDLAETLPAAFESPIQEGNNQDLVARSVGTTDNPEVCEPLKQSTSMIIIPNIKLQRTFRLSLSQEMFWFLWVYLEDKASLNHTAWARITGRINVPQFQKAIHALGQDHEILRTRIIEEAGKPLQSVMDTTLLHLEVRNITGNEEVQECVNMLQTHVYDIARGQTARALLLSKSSEEHFFVAGLHPLIADGLSFQSFLKMAQRRYVSGRLNTGHKARPYLEYAEKQYSDMESGHLQQDLQFWKVEFDTLPPPLPILNISGTNSRPDLMEYENLQVRFDVGLDTKQRIQELCRQHMVTPFHFYLSVFRTLLLRLSPIADGEDVIIGIGDANRTEEDMMDVIGPFVNFLPIRLRADRSNSFTDLLQQTRSKAYSALSHSKIPFQTLLNEYVVSCPITSRIFPFTPFVKLLTNQRVCTRLGFQRSASYTSLFQCFVNYRQGMRKSSTWSSGPDSFMVHAIEIGIPRMGYDITLEMVDYVDGECTQLLALRRDIYTETEAQHLVQIYERLLHAFLADPRLCLDEVNLFSTDETQEAMKLSRGPSRESCWPETVVHRIEHVSDEYPNSIAIQDGEMAVTYKEMSTASNAVAVALNSVNVSPGDIAIVLMEPNFAFMTCLLGIMRTGAVYLPLELSWPVARLSSIVQACQPRFMLIDQATSGLVSSLEIHTKTIIIDVDNIEKRVDRAPIAATTRSAAALLYTSGSSGVPKGILVQHAGLRNWAEFTPPTYNLGKEVVLQQTTPTFDLSLVQILTALCHGGKLCLVPRKKRGDAQTISNLITSNEVTFTCATPSEYASWLNYGSKGLHECKSWKTAFCIGEHVPQSLPLLIKTLKLPTLELYNLYGPTEASLAATGLKLPREAGYGTIAAGCPLPNYSIYVLDSQLRPVPIGVQGEIYIGGAGVGLGYINQPDLTTMRFVPNVFATPEDQESGWITMHRTGDFGRWNQDGALLVEGRIDMQVKLRGIRIDLSEVEQAIIDAGDGAVYEAAALVRKLSVGTPECLVAYAVFKRKDDVESQISGIKSKLSTRLPQYMCPATIVSIDKLITTSSGKLDRNALSRVPLPVNENGGESGEVVMTDTEASMKTIWEKMLGVNVEITSDTDFFHVGGSSLLLLRLQADIKCSFNVTMPLIRMFEDSTLRAVAHWVEQGTEPDMTTDEYGAPVDWNEETSLPADLLEMAVSPSQRTHNTGSLVVVLTGATGNLGRALLEGLVLSTKIKHVHCLAVRNVQKRRSIATFNHDKITLHEGDLLSPRLGLSEMEASSIFESADVVIHNAADMSYLKSYNTLRAANLQSTKTLAVMSAKYNTRLRSRFHYISTISVGNVVATAMNNGGSVKGRDIDTMNYFVFGPHSVAAHHPPVTVSSKDIIKTAHGYIATKWASEVFLEHLHDKFPEWPVVIHRPSLIARDESLGLDKEKSDANVFTSLEFVDNIRHYATLMGAIPGLPMLEEGQLRVSGAFNVVPLKKVAMEVVGAVLEGDGYLNNTVQFQHHLGDLELPLSEPRAWVANEGSAEDFPDMDPFTWTQKAGDLGMHPTMVALVHDLANVRGHLVFPRLKK